MQQQQELPSSGGRAPNSSDDGKGSHVTAKGLIGCKAFKGSAPSGNYENHDMDDEVKDKMETFFNQAVRYCDKV